MTYVYAYEHCATCDHLGASHAPDGHCMAQAKRGIGPSRGMMDCLCKAFVLPTKEQRDERQAKH